LKTLNIDIDLLSKDDNVFDDLEILRNIANKIVENDDSKEKFKVITNTMLRIYESLKPEVFEDHRYNEKFNILKYIN